MRSSILLLPLAYLLLAWGFAEPAASASEQAELGPAGKVTGDLAGGADVDTLGVDLVAGSSVTVKTVSDVDLVVELRDPQGELVPLPFEGRRKRIARKVPVMRTGRHELTVRSQAAGDYALSVRVRWARRVVFEGDTAGAFEVGVPAGGAVRAVVKARRRSGLTPAIASLDAPDGSQVAGRVDGKGGKAKLPKTPVTQDGLHLLRVDAGGSGPFKVVVRRTVPRLAASKLDLREQPAPVSFEADGVKAIFSRRCTGCHSWASGYPGVRARASNALRRIQDGSMPRFGPKLPRAEIELIEAWVDGGRAP